VTDEPTSELLARYERAMDDAMELVVSASVAGSTCRVATAANVERMLAEHDLLLRRLGAWPTPDRWSEDREAALLAVRRQLVDVLLRTEDGPPGGFPIVAQSVADLVHAISWPSASMA
jgi:hypothetical protein